MEKRSPMLSIVGPYPPPYGGVSTHIVRLCSLLDRKGVNYKVYNIGSNAEDQERVVSVYRYRHLFMLWYMFFGEEPAIYIVSTPHSVAWLVGATVATWRGKRVIVRLQNSRLIDRITCSRWQRALVGLALRKMTAIVCVNAAIAEMVKSLKVDTDRIHCFPGFLPPICSPTDRKLVAREVWDFARKHSPIIAANGKVSSYRGQDLYGLDHMVELAACLKPDYPEIGIIVCLCGDEAKDRRYLRQLRAVAAEKRIAGNILWNTRNGVFVPVLAEADVFVRPTNTDGDANSLREALYLGVPSVASDVVERPKGTILFRTRDTRDLEAKVRQVLQKPVGRLKKCRPCVGFAESPLTGMYIEMISSLAQGHLNAFKNRTNTL